MNWYPFQKSPSPRLTGTTVRVLVLFIFIFAANLTVIGCGTATAPLTEPDSRLADDRITQSVDQLLGTDWYGIYHQEKKIGYGNMQTSREKETTGDTYRFSFMAMMTLQSAKTTHQMGMETCWRFDGKPPYALIEHTVKMTTGKDISEIKIFKGAHRYQASILQGNETRMAEMEQFSYSLEDLLAVETWIQSKPQVGDRIEFSNLNTDTLKIDKATAEILEIRNTIVNGVRIKHYKLNTAFTDDADIVAVHGADGTPYTMSLGGLVEMRLEPESLALRMDRPIDLFFRNMVHVSKNLGNPARIVRLKLGVDKASGEMLGEAPGQAVERDSANARYIVTNTSGGNPRIKATLEEIQKNLAATIDIPMDHPKVVNLAQEAVSGANTTAEKVARLVRFVAQYIEDDLSADPLTLMDLIARRKGDCNQHALLFTALARALDIPCRMVVGLMYIGDSAKAFGPHAWNEVVMDGQWIPVDPTWDQTTIDATHLRFPTSTKEWIQVLAAVPQMRLTVLDYKIEQ